MIKKQTLPFKSSTKYLSKLADSHWTSVHEEWSSQEDIILEILVNIYGNNNWDTVSTELNSNRSSAECMIRWKLINQSFTRKGPWTQKEDKLLIDWVNNNDDLNWKKCSQIPGRSSKQCKVRWINSLNPKIVTSEWKIEEDYIIYTNFKKVGSGWTHISKLLPGRTDLAIKNRFNSKIRNIISWDWIKSEADLEKAFSKAYPIRLKEANNTIGLKGNANTIQSIDDDALGYLETVYLNPKPN